MALLPTWLPLPASAAAGSRYLTARPHARTKFKMSVIDSGSSQRGSGRMLARNWSFWASWVLLLLLQLTLLLNFEFSISIKEGERELTLRFRFIVVYACMDMYPLGTYVYIHMCNTQRKVCVPQTCVPFACLSPYLGVEVELGWRWREVAGQGRGMAGVLIVAILWACCLLDFFSIATVLQAFVAVVARLVGVGGCSLCSRLKSIANNSQTYYKEDNSSLPYEEIPSERKECTNCHKLTRWPHWRCNQQN